MSTSWTPDPTMLTFHLLSQESRSRSRSPPIPQSKSKVVAPVESPSYTSETDPTWRFRKKYDCVVVEDSEEGFVSEEGEEEEVTSGYDPEKLTCAEIFFMENPPKRDPGLAQHYGLDIPPPSLQSPKDIKKSYTNNNNNNSSSSTNNKNKNNKNIKNKNKNGKKGMNFAVVGSRAVDAQFYQRRGIYDTVTNVSMTDQLDWFLLHTLPSLCDDPPSSDCQSVMEKSLFVLGEFGGNDYTHALLSGKNVNDITPFVPIVAQTIAHGVHRVVEAGARTMMVPSVLPLGCAASYLTYYPSPKEEDYDENGCLIWVNEMASYHNQLLQDELSHLRDRHPHAHIVYADLFHAAMQIYDDPGAFGFSKGALTACCGGGGPYNFNPGVQCGDEGATGCENPSQYVNWDGYHLTETAYSVITNALLDGPFTYPPINSLCRYPSLAQL